MLPILMSGIPVLELENYKIRQLYQKEVQDYICLLALNDTQPNNMYNTYPFDPIVNINYQSDLH